MSRRNNSGQALLLGVLLIALLLLSVELYVYEVGKAIDTANSNSFSDSIFAVRLGSRHVVIGSLANISQGGANQNLELNLESWSSFVGKQYQFGKHILNFTVREASPYSSGIWISWGTNGSGVSGAYANFTLKLLDRGIEINQTYAINVTTTLSIQGSYSVIGGNTKQVNVTSNLLNEGAPALAKNLTVYYNNSSDWIVPGSQNNYTIIDYGNGTYFMSFIADIPSENVEVSVHVSDLRDITVQANVTCTET
ncbi:hypothetical protein DRO69_12460 [Candidatus Bathyarchaeota archaeon]|nr:MAG: hypothetical protein DRO69_12460 [Candidatus Bathyarchaeota archaeon]